MNLFSSQSPSLKQSRSLADIVGVLWVAALTLYLVVRIWPALFIPWWFNTDEVVFYYEVIRQLRLDPGQTFFDIPGTPFVTLTSILTSLGWVCARLIGWTETTGPSDFAFEQIQGVFSLMRFITLGGYLIAVALTYDLMRRSAGYLVAGIASLLMATLPIHLHYSHFVRTESLGLVLTLAAIWIITHGRRPQAVGTYLTAGLLMGVAVGARFHFALVGPPIVAALYWMRDRPRAQESTSAPHPGLTRIAMGMGAMFAAGALIALLYRSDQLGASWLTHRMLLSTPAGPEQYAGAKATVAKLWLLLGTFSGATLTLYVVARTRRWLEPFIHPRVLGLLVGVAAGFLFSHPTFLWQGEHQLRSIQFYSDWVDPNLESMTAWGSWWNVTSYYFTAALPERWWQGLFLIGTGAILWRRDPVWRAFLVGAAVCFVAHPTTMKLWPHHIIPWLPFLCFVAAAPAQIALELINRRTNLAWVKAGAGAVIITLSTMGLLGRLPQADSYLQTSRARTDQIGEMNAWLEKEVPGDAYLVVSYFSLGAGGFMQWIQNSGVSVPDWARVHRDVHIWWLERSALEGRHGYLCVSRADIAFFRDDFERRNPGSTFNPFEDPGFTSLATFGGGFYELQVFRFDFRASSPSSAPDHGD